MNEGNILLGMYVLNASHCSIVHLANDKLMGSYELCDGCYGEG